MGIGGRPGRKLRKGPVRPRAGLERPDGPIIAGGAGSAAQPILRTIFRPERGSDRRRGGAGAGSGLRELTRRRISGAGVPGVGSERGERGERGEAVRDAGAVRPSGGGRGGVERIEQPGANVRVMADDRDTATVPKHDAGLAAVGAGLPAFHHFQRIDQGGSSTRRQEPALVDLGASAATVVVVDGVHGAEGIIAQIGVGVCASRGGSVDGRGFGLRGRCDGAKNLTRDIPENDQNPVNRNRVSGAGGIEHPNPCLCVVLDGEAVGTGVPGHSFEHIVRNFDGDLLHGLKATPRIGPTGKRAIRGVMEPASGSTPTPIPDCSGDRWW